MNAACPRLVIAGTRSGTGKTSVSLALTWALRRRGLRVQTFKVGPDFLDPTYHTIASGRPCYNLDGWMMGEEYVRDRFARAAASADIAIIEGVMGLFDGASAADSSGSTAEIARWLEAPVLLIEHAHGAARSLAASVKGFAEFERGVTVAGVIANQCGSARHAQWLIDSLAAASLPPVLGAIPRGSLPELPSRHLGLVSADPHNLPASVLDALAEAVEQHGSVAEMIALSQRVPPLTLPAKTEPAAPPRVRLGLASDTAFHFYYADTLDELARRGCELVRFSPCREARLPEGLDGLYLGGGYPELQAAALSGNAQMLDSVRRFAASGRPIYAECGGLMYLAQGLEADDGSRYPLLGLLPAWTRMRKTKRALGYAEVTLTADSLWGRRGAVQRGHEFHYSELVDDPLARPEWQATYGLRRLRSEAPELEGFQRGNVLASYVHLHHASQPGAIEHFIAHCEAARPCVAAGAGGRA